VGKRPLQAGMTSTEKSGEEITVPETWTLAPKIEMMKLVDLAIIGGRRRAKKP
jgi:hypothetical protein